MRKIDGGEREGLGVHQCAHGSLGIVLVMICSICTGKAADIKA